MSDDTDMDVLRFLAVYDESLDRNVGEADATAEQADAAIGDAQRLLLRVGPAVLC
jgi:hypothetical protein